MSKVSNVANLDGPVTVADLRKFLNSLDAQYDDVVVQCSKGSDPEGFLLQDEVDGVVLRVDHLGNPELKVF